MQLYEETAIELTLKLVNEGLEITDDNSEWFSKFYSLIKDFK